MFHYLVLPLISESGNFISKIALQRIGEPDDIAKAILFLITNGDYITGQNIVVDGGLTVW